MRLVLIVGISFLFAVPAAFSQSADGQPADTYAFNIINDADRTLRFRCTNDSTWTTLSPDNDLSVACTGTSVTLFTRLENPAGAQSQVVAHNCPDGTRTVTVTEHTDAYITGTSGVQIDPDAVWSWTYTSECVTETPGQ